MDMRFTNIRCWHLHRGLCLGLLLMACVVALCAASYAQETTGTVLGTVTDQAGAIVPGAKVSIKNADRNAVERVLRSDQAGEFTAPLLPIGHYEVSVEAKGFKTFAESNLTLNVNDKLNVKAVLTVGGMNETVSVEADELQVDTQSATAQGLITGVQVRELALASRNYEQLVALMPGVTSDIGDSLFAGVSAPSGDTNETAFSLNGSFGTGNNWTVDGADNVDRGGNFTLAAPSSFQGTITPTAARPSSSFRKKRTGLCSPVRPKVLFPTLKSAGRTRAPVTS